MLANRPGGGALVPGGNVNTLQRINGESHNQYQPPTVMMHRDPRFQHPTAFTTTKYLINDDFAELLGLSEPVTRKEVQNAFINYAINHDFVDLKAHHYLVYKNARLKSMLGADTIHPKNLFKYLRKMLVPIQRPLTDADVEKIRVKSQMKRAEMRMRKLAQNNAKGLGKYAQGSCITEMQMELKKEIEQAEVDDFNYGTIKLDLTPSVVNRQKGGKKQPGLPEGANISIDDLLTEGAHQNMDYSVLFKR